MLSLRRCFPLPSLASVRLAQSRKRRDGLVSTMSERRRGERKVHGALLDSFRTRLARWHYHTKGISTPVQVRVQSNWSSLVQTVCAPGTAVHASASARIDRHQQKQTQMQKQKHMQTRLQKEARARPQLLPPSPGGESARPFSCSTSWMGTICPCRHMVRPKSPHLSGCTWEAPYELTLSLW